MADSPGAPDDPGLTVTLGARSIVASDLLLSQADSLAQLDDSLGREAAQLASLLAHSKMRASLALDVPAAALDAHRTMDAALARLTLAHQRASGLRRAVLASLTEYTHTEEFAMSVLHHADEQVGWSLGLDARVFAVPMLIGAGEAILLGWLVSGRSPAQFAAALHGLLGAHGRILTTATRVSQIREMTADADGFGDGFLEIPPQVAAAAHALGFTNVSTSSAGVVALGSAFGLFRESGVSVRKTSSVNLGTAPSSLLERADSFPDPKTDLNGEQIRINRYVEPGQPDRFDVYIAGTVTFDPKAEAEPFDLTSDLTGVAQESPGSYRAVVDAMKQAGVTSTSPVVLNGYSQGGLLASLLAASGKYNVKGVVTFGAPSGPVHIPASVPVLTVRNTEDLVPATSGYDVNPNAVVVQRAVFADQPIPTQWAVPAHRLSYYQETAAVVDAARSSDVRKVLDPLNRFASGATSVDSTLWVATRVPRGS